MIKTLKLICLLIPVACPADTGDQVDQDPVEHLKTIREENEATESVFFNFTQERHLRMFVEPLISKGSIMFKQPNQVRWQTTEPYGSILLADERDVAQFEEDSDGWRKLNLGFPGVMKMVMGQVSSMHQGEFEKLSHDFDLSIKSGSVLVVTMKPKDKKLSKMMSAIELFVTPDFSSTHKIVLQEERGDKTVILVYDEVRNFEFPDRTFDMDEPLSLEEVKAAIPKKEVAGTSLFDETFNGVDSAGEEPE